MQTSSLSALLLLAVPLIDAFVSPNPTMTDLESVFYSVPRLSEIDEMCLENVAELCVGEESALTADECDLEDHEALLNQLEAQKEHLVEHMHKIDSLMGKLRGTGSDEEEPLFFARRVAQ